MEKKEGTFKPEVNKNSETLDQNYKANMFNGDQLHRWDQLYLMKDKYQLDKELRRIEKDRREAEIERNLFKPNVSTSRTNLNTSYR